MKDFIVDQEKRQFIIKKKRKEASCFYKTGRLFSGVILFIAVVSLIWGIYIINSNHIVSSYGLAIYGILILGVGTLCAIWRVARMLIEKKFLWLWTSFSNEQLHLKKNGFEYGRYAKHRDRDYRTWLVKYSDIVRMEYDQDNYCLRVFGPLQFCVWSSQNRERCLDRFEITDVQGEMASITIVAYFENFEMFMEELENKSGKKIMKCNIAIE